MTDPAPLRDILRTATGNVGGDDPIHAGTIWRHWRTIVGDAIAAHAEPTSLRAGVLRVRTDSPAWATEVSYLGEDIATKANRQVGSDAVREVRVWTSPEPIRVQRAAAAARISTGTGNAPEEVFPDDPRGALAAAYTAWKKRWSRARSRDPEKP